MKERENIFELLRAAAMMFLFLLLTSQIRAAVFVVDTLSDTTTNNGCASANRNTCSLREAILTANARVGADVINFNPGLTGTITLSNGEILIGDSLIINGPGARLLTLSGNNASRILTISGSSAVVIINGLTFTNGNVKGIFQGGSGGAIHVINGAAVSLSGVTIQNCAADLGGGIANLFGRLNIQNSTISNNNADQGGGINNQGVANIANTTISNNIAQSDGGGLINFSVLTLNNVTVTGNHSGVDAGGIEANDNGTAIRNTIVAGNTANRFGPDINGYATSLGGNLIGILTPSGGHFFDGVNGDIVGTLTSPVNSMLGPLQNNGGPTNTHALLPGSLAIDGGNNCVVTATCPSNNPLQPLTTDQRGTGFARLVGSVVDIGAFEVQSLGADRDGDGIHDTCDTDSNSGATDFDNDGIVDSSGCDTEIGPPTNKNQCKTGGWMFFNFPRIFRNQGDCIQFVNTGM